MTGMASDDRGAFAQRHGWGPQDADKAVGAIPWLRRDAMAKGRAALEAVYAKGATSIQAWAAARDIPVDRALRNLIAGASATELDDFRILLAAVRVLGPALADEEAHIRAALGPIEGQLAPDIEPADGPHLSDAHILSILAQNPRRLAEWKTQCHAVDNPDATVSERVAAALRFSEGEQRRFRLQLVKRSLHLYPASGVMTVEDFKRLGSAEVAGLLRWRHLLPLLTGGALGIDALVAELEAWRADLWHATCQQLVDEIGDRKLTPGTLQLLRDEPTFTSVPAELVGPLRNAVASPANGRRMSANDADRKLLLAMMPADLRSAMGFLLSSDRSRAISSASPADLLSIARALDPTELATVFGSDRRLGVQNFLAAITVARKDTDVMRLLLPADGSPGPAAPDAIADLLALWVGVTPLRSPAREIALAAASTSLPPTSSTLANLADSDPSVIGVHRLLDFLGQPGQRTASLVHGGGAPTVAAYRRLVAALRETGWHVARDGGDVDRSFALALAPQETIDLLLETGDLLDEDVASTVGASEIRKRLQGKEGAGRLRALLDLALRLGRPLPRALHGVIAGNGETLALVVETAGATLPLETRVEIALRSPVAGRYFDASMGTADRLAALDHVRATFSGRPAVAAAYEVATAFSFAYAPYLVALAGQVRVPATDQERGRQFDHLYRTYQLPKQSGGSRTITAPQRGLKGVQRMLLAKGFARLPLEDAATGFRPGRSIKDNAQVHVRQPLVVNIDIHSFFPSTGFDRILRVTRKLADGRLSERAARFLADICSYQGALPTGAPTSPVIGNLVLAGIDRALTTAAASRDVHYTRYADDLTFSGDDAALKMVPFARRLLRELGYELDTKKTNIFRRGRRQMVTGLVVNEHADLPRRLRRRLRAAVHRRSLGGAPEWHGRPMNDEMLRGWLSFLAMLRPEDGAAALSVLAEIRAHEHVAGERGDG